MKNKKYITIPILAVLLLGVFAVGLAVNPTITNSVGDEISYGSMVCKQVTRADGTIEPKECEHNVLYDTGKEAIEDYLMEGTGGGDAFDWIELGDANLVIGDPSAGKAEDYTAHAADGLSTAAGTTGTNAASGNWTIYHEFTSTGDAQVTNVSRLQNGAGVDLAGNKFTLVTLQTGDKLNVTWDVWVV